jgi:chemotaxis protein MotB
VSRKKKQEHLNHERWLISYADFITLLFALFVVLFASGQADKKKEARLAASIQSAFNEMGVFDTHSKAASATETPDDSVSAAPTPVPATAEDKETARVRERLIEAAQLEISRGVIAIHESSAGLTVSLEEAGFFNSGAADIRPSALPVLERIAAALPESALRVEGHTDDVPIHTPQFASNWELSSARASSITRLLLAHPKIHPELMSVAGYAEFHPVASNATADGRARNRRVDIVILAPSRLSSDPQKTTP